MKEKFEPVSILPALSKIFEKYVCSNAYFFR